MTHCRFCLSFQLYNQYEYWLLSGRQQKLREVGIVGKVYIRSIDMVFPVPM